MRDPIVCGSAVMPIPYLTPSSAKYGSVLLHLRTHKNFKKTPVADVDRFSRIVEPR